MLAGGCVLYPPHSTPLLLPEWIVFTELVNSRFGRQLFQNPDDSAIWFDSDAIIDRRPNPLLAAKVSLGRLNRDMSQQELDLLQFAS